jgi:tRNA (guanine10-N2)-dimethyltransferase
MHLIQLSGENIELARLEAETLLCLKDTKLVQSYLYCTIPTDKMNIINRLAYTRKVYEIAYVTSRKNLENSLESYPWINVYEKNFCLRITSSEHYDERYYSGFIWKNLEKSIRPKVDLDTPNLLIEIFIDKELATVTRLLYQNFETFEGRKAHMMPVLHPTTMHPKMARALINVLNPKLNDKVLDPFCGACGILTEAGLIGVKFTGYDIDDQILRDAKKNLEFCDVNPKHYTLIKKDATTIKDMKNVVTDLPYGKSSKKSEELLNLYAKFLKNISGRAVVVMPSFMPVKNILEKNLSKKLAVITIIDHYVHKSLTRKIVLIDVKSGKSVSVKAVGVKSKILKTKSYHAKRTAKHLKKTTPTSKKHKKALKIVKKPIKHTKALKHKK